MKGNAGRYLTAAVTLLLLINWLLPLSVYGRAGFVSDLDRSQRINGGVVPQERELPRLVDDADLLSDKEKKEVEARLDAISETWACDVVVATVQSMTPYTSSQEYADDFFDYHGYGQGSGKDGILLLISMEDRDWAVSTSGFGIRAFTDAGQNYIMEAVTKSLSAGDYDKAFTVFAEDCDDFIRQAKEGHPYDFGNLPRRPLPWIFFPLCLLASLILANIMAYGKKQRHFTIRKANQAYDYISGQGLYLTESEDRFIRQETHVTVIPKESSRGGGSSIHMGSSGNSHGGSSGKF